MHPDNAGKSAGKKRSAPDDAEEAGASKRQQVERPLSNLANIPLELRAKIVRNIVQPNDVPGTLQNVNNLQQSNTSLAKAVEYETGFKAISDLGTKIGESRDLLDEIPFYNQHLDEKAQKLLGVTTEADFLSLESSDRRSAIVSNILKYKYSKFPTEAVVNLVSNLEYLKPEERSRVAEYVTGYQKDEGYAEDLVSRLIEKSEHLSSEKRSSLVDESCSSANTEERKYDVAVWADKMHLLSEADQSKVLGVVKESEGVKGPVLARFAENLEGVSPAGRADLANEILQLPAAQESKWHALSSLAKHLPALDAQDQRDVSSYIAARLQANVEEPVNEDRSWYVNPEFCKVEAAHHLSTHEILLNDTPRQQVGSFINRIVDGNSVDDYPRQAQLINHLSEEKRSNFVEDALYDDDADISGIIYGLTARVESLNTEERNEYLKTLDYDTMHYDSNIETISYNMKNSMSNFDKSEIKKLLKMHLSVAENNDIQFADSAISVVAKNAKYLDHEDVNLTIRTTKRLVEKHIRDDDNSDVQYCAGHAARCLAGWARETLSNSKQIYGKAPVPAEQHTMNTADTTAAPSDAHHQQQRPQLDPRNRSVSHER